ncbi:hypothetical protein SmJEL517_g04215 [Synchytrium microbalum]|uniref:Cell morphogenesis protein N-terminal domain-containing protein n=1 Tax=Synchytrium microbalum TaxID=1806994 RepID=A0A507C5C4_9FUNG|nr:uncharacterized protein SmJEL517_g04215 [Synchytrium microbalum]TPX32743.1 hypothetical protein SmJEL517_g04215 [Synchytrium microbalum]
MDRTSTFPRGSHSNVSTGSSQVDPDSVYLQKLRDSLASLHSIKQTAVANENFILAEQTSAKLQALRVQVATLEHKLNADVLTNHMTQWQNSLAESLGNLLKSGGSQSVRKASTNFNYPLNEPFHQSMLSLLRLVPPAYLESLMKAFLIILPLDMPGLQKSPYGFDFFLKKLPPTVQSNASHVELVKSVVLLGVLDCLIVVTEHSALTRPFKKETNHMLLKHAFYNIRLAGQTVSKRAASTEGRFMEQMMLRWSILIGDVSSVERHGIVSTIFGVLDPTRKALSEEIVLVLAATRYLSTKPVNQQQAEQLFQLIRELSNQIDRTKKTVVRVAAIQALEYIIRPLDYTSAGGKPRQPWEVMLVDEIYELYKRARRWAVDEQVRRCSFRLIVAILVNSPYEFFRSHIDNFVLKDLIIATTVNPQSKRKPDMFRPFVYECVLQLLRGRFYTDTKDQARQRIARTFSQSASFMFMTRPLGEEPAEVINRRLKDMADALFFKRTRTFGVENLDVCVDLTVQMGVQNLAIAFRVIQSLMENKVSQDLESQYIGVKALRIILDPESSFGAAAQARGDRDFDAVVTDLPYEFENLLSQILHQCDFQAGIAALGKSQNVFEPVPFGSGRSRGMGSISESNVVMSDTSSQIQDDVMSIYSDVPDREAQNVRASYHSEYTGSVTMSMAGDAIDHDALSSTLNRIPLFAASDMSRPDSTLERVATLDRVVTLERSRNSSAASSPRNSIAMIPDEVYVAQQKANDHVAACIKTWSRAYGQSADVGERLGTPVSMLARPSPKLKSPRHSIRPEIGLTLRVFREVLRLVPLIPAPSIIGGEWFVGVYLMSNQEEIAWEASYSIQRVFVRNPTLRLRQATDEILGNENMANNRSLFIKISVINGFINCIKSTEHQDEVSLLTIILHLQHLISGWSKESNVISDPDASYRVSCKLDAAVIVLLAHTDPRIRKCSIQCLGDFLKITGRLQPGLDQTDQTVEMPLYSVLVRTEISIARRALYSFLERDLEVTHLVQTASNPTPPTFSDVASSEYMSLYRAFLGELARQFARLGRSKALRHTAKFVRTIAIPMLNPPQGDPAEDSVELYSSFAILLFAFGGIPLKSEHEFPSGATQQVQDTLLNLYLRLLAPILCSEKEWEANSIARASYYTHPAILQVVVFDTWSTFKESETVGSQPSSAKSSPNRSGIAPRGPPSTLRNLANFVNMLRYICQSPDFTILAREPSVVPTPIVAVLSEVLSTIETILGSGAEVAVSTMKLRMTCNHCVIVDRLSETLLSGPANLSELWPPAIRNQTFRHLLLWSSTLHDTTAPTSNKTGQIRPYIGVAVESLLDYADVYEGRALPRENLQALVRMESEGRRVFGPTLLYNLDHVIGVVMVQAYSGRAAPPGAFADAIFDLILPRPHRESQMFMSLDAESRSASLRDYISLQHALPLKPEESHLIYPNLTPELEAQIKRHLGSILFFGLYSMMNASRSIRNRAFLFVLELVRLFGASPMDEEMSAAFASLNGWMATSIGHTLKPKIVAINRRAAALFSSHVAGFTWEAVRCSRSQSKGTPEHVMLTLIPPGSWILDLLAPWLHQVDLSESAPGEGKYEELLRFLLETAFLSPQMSRSEVLWEELAAGHEGGERSTVLLLDILVHVLSFDGPTRETALNLLGRLLMHRPKLVAAELSHYLSHRAFPWSKAKEHNENLKAPHSAAVVKNLVTYLHTSLFPHKTSLAGNDYVVTCKSAIVCISELLIQDFAATVAQQPILLNYVILHLPDTLSTTSAATFLLGNLVEGYVSFITRAGAMNDDTYDTLAKGASKLLVLMEGAVVRVKWPDPLHLSADAESGGNEITVQELLDLLLATFEPESPGLREAMARETLHWASEGYLPADQTMRGVELYNMLISLAPPPAVNSLDALESRLLDHVSVIGSIEVDLRGNTKESWSYMSEGQRQTQLGSRQVLASILTLHQTLIIQYGRNGVLHQHPHLFWDSLCIINFPVDVFPDLVSRAMDNCILYMTNQGESRALAPSALDESFLDSYDRVKSGFPGLQQLLLPSLFAASSETQVKAFELLLRGWCLLPDYIVDQHPSIAMLYTLLYSVTFLFGRLLEDDGSEPGHSRIVAALLAQVLTTKKPFDFTATIRNLEAYVESPENPDPANADDLLQRVTANLAEVYEAEIATIADYFGFIVRVQPRYAKVVYRMTETMWSFGRPKSAALKNFVKKLPFVSEGAGASLIVSVLHDTPDGGDAVDGEVLDLSSHGKQEVMNVPIIPSSTVRHAQAMLSNMGIAPTRTLPHSKGLKTRSNIEYRMEPTTVLSLPSTIGTDENSFGTAAGVFDECWIEAERKVNHSLRNAASAGQLDTQIILRSPSLLQAFRQLTQEACTEEHLEFLLAASKLDDDFRLYESDPIAQKYILAVGLYTIQALYLERNSARELNITQTARIKVSKGYKLLKNLRRPADEYLLILRPVILEVEELLQPLVKKLARMELNDAQNWSSDESTVLKKAPLSNPSYTPTSGKNLYRSSNIGRKWSLDLGIKLVRRQHSTISVTVSI